MIPAIYALIGAAGLAGLLMRADRRERLASLLLVAAGTLALLAWLGVAHTLRAHAAAAAVALVVALAAGVAAARGLQRWATVDAMRP